MTAPQLTPTEAIEALAAAAADRGVVLNRVKVAKLLYLADLAAVERGDHAFTGIPWVWDNYGPWNNAFYSWFERCQVDGTLQETIVPTFSGSPEHRYTATDQIVRAASDWLQYLEEVLEAHGAKSAVELRDLVYRTEPMKRVQATGKRGDALDLGEGRGSFLDAAFSIDDSDADEDPEVDLPHWLEDPQRELLPLTSAFFDRR